MTRHIARWLADSRQDVRLAIRTLRRSPGFAAAALATLALGIGATTAVFSVVHGVLMRPLPFPGADRLVRVWEEHRGGQSVGGNRWITNRTYHAWVARPRTIDVIGGFGEYDRTLRFGDEDVRLSGTEVSPSLLAALGPRPLLGRLFDAADAEAGAPPVVLLSERLWRDRLSADPGVVGRVLTIDGKPHAIAGVIEGRFYFPNRRGRFWIPYVVQRVSADPALSQRTSGLSAIARVATGASSPQVEAEGTAIARSVPVTASTETLFGKGGPPVVHTRPLVEDMTGDVKPALLILSAAVACVLLIACANVANLVLCRGVIRQRELAVRAAVGAGRGRLVRQLLAESVVLSAAGGLAGVGLAWSILRALPALAPTQFPRLDDVGLDERVLASAAVTSIATLVLSGVIPALRGARFGLAGSLHGGDGAIAGGFRGPRARRLRDALLIAESAFAVMLLVGACLLARSFATLVRVDAGYTADHVLTVRAVMPQGAAPERASQFVDAVLRRLRGTSAVIAAGAGNMMPMVPMTAISSFPLSRPGASEPTMTRSVTYAITPGYAEALGLRLRQGRLLDAHDATSGVRALVVNEEFVRQYLTSPAVGHRFDAGLYLNEEKVPSEIVGIVGDVLKDGNDRRPQPEIYFAHGSRGRGITGSVSLVVRTSGDPSALSATLRQLIREVDRGVSVERVMPLEEQVSASMAQPRFAMAVLVTFASVALALASVGLYGVLSYAVSQRRREFGVRAALGASRARLVGLVLADGLALTGIGAIGGLTAAAALTRLMQSALFGVTPLDITSFASAAALLLVVAAAACLVPGSRAASVHPAEALRSE